MNVQKKAQDLFQYIAEVYAVDLPVNRNVLSYGAERWWQADLIESRFCTVQRFNGGEDTASQEEESVSISPWLSVYKTICDQPPPLPEALAEWIDLSPDPTKKPVPKKSIIVRVAFEADPDRVTAYKCFEKEWIKWDRTKQGIKPVVPDECDGWLDMTNSKDFVPIPFDVRELEVSFDQDPQRSLILQDYLSSQWELWAQRTLPQFKANQIYDALYSLHQILSVEGDRWEILWGHLLLSWAGSKQETVYHPLFVTPLFVEFHPDKRNITLSPSHITYCDLDCLRDLRYDNKDALIEHARKLNEAEQPVDPWNHNQMRGISATITGYLSTEADAQTNRYGDLPSGSPPFSSKPTIYNSPIIFVRERARHFWIEDARKVATAIASGRKISTFVRAAVGDETVSNSGRLTWADSGSPENKGAQEPMPNDEESELYFPLEFNDQQKEIWDRLKKQFGVLVQGPPGTGKSHTIANIVSAVLATGGKVLVTSQTENALKVLRGLIPLEIRSLCVTQLGNDAESRKQLNEAVTAIGQHLVEKGSPNPQRRLGQIHMELEILSREQSRIRNAIRDWVSLDSERITISGESVSAQHAAKECSLNQQECEWWTDKISPECEPPLTDEELTSLCSILNKIPATIGSPAAIS
jgi:hypothetical protein